MRGFSPKKTWLYDFFAGLQAHLESTRLKRFFGKFFVGFAFVAFAAGCGGTGTMSPPAGRVVESGVGIVHQFVIPEGTHTRIAQGESPNIFPDEIVFGVGETVRFVNDDKVGQTIGPYYVAAGSVLEQTFRAPQVIEGICTAHEDNRIRIEVVDRRSSVS